MISPIDFKVEMTLVDYIIRYMQNVYINSPAGQINSEDTYYPHFIYEAKTEEDYVICSKS